jgi:GDPmannose 4,6-dehydratase
MYGYWITVNYREAYNMYACNGILFNHESPIRGETFVTRKITRAASRIAVGLQDKLFLGNLDAKRDWGHAKDYIEAMYLMLQQPQPEDFVIATGITTEVREFVRMSFRDLGIGIEFKGQAEKEIGFVSSLDESRLEFLEIKNQNLKVGKEIIFVDPLYYRPTEVDLLIGDPTKAHQKLGWTPKYDLNALVNDMMKGDLKLMKKEKYLLDGGYKVFNYFE